MSAGPQKPQDHAISMTPEVEGSHGMPREVETRGVGTAVPLIEALSIGKTYGNIVALQNVSTRVDAGQVTCVLGDNGAGKSSLIKILAGAQDYDSGQLLVDGKQVHFNSPRDALDKGIATVYQDLAIVPMMPVWRNFFLGSEPTKPFGPFKRLDVAGMKAATKAELADMGINLRDVDQPIGTLSGGERQCVAIARAVHFGARVLILDEPTAALGVKQTQVVLRYIAAARDRGLGVVFITHNPHHAFPIGDRFLLLQRGHSLGDFTKTELTLPGLTEMMAGQIQLAD